MRRFGCLVLAAAAAACSSGSSGGGGSSGPTEIDGVPVIAGFDPGPAPAAGTGFQVVLPIVENIAAGASEEICTWTDIVLDQDIWVKESIGYQTESGHHIIVYYTPSPSKAGVTRECTDADMASFRFGVGAGGEGLSEDNKLPGDLAVRIPKGSQIVLNHHYLNSSSKPIAQAQSAVNVLYAAPGSTIVQTSSLAFVDSSMTVPPGTASVEYTCTMKEDMATWELLPHMHYYGTHIAIDHISGTTTKRLFDLDWDPNYMFHPPILTNDPSTPFQMAKGDQIHIKCDYNNTTGAPLNFGQEMCVSYAQTVDTAKIGNMECDQGSWGTF